MSVLTSTKVWTYSRTRGAGLLALAALADIADDEGLCWPSVEYLAEKLRQDERNTRMVLGKLKKAGELYVIPRNEWNSKLRRKSNAYIIMAGMTEERFIRACQHDPLNYTEAYARQLYRAIPPESVPSGLVFNPRREQNPSSYQNDQPIIEASSLYEPRYDRIDVNPAGLPADNPDHLIRVTEPELQNNPDDMIRVTESAQEITPDHLISVEPANPDDMIRVNGVADGVYPDHLIPSTLIKRSPNTSYIHSGGAGDSVSPIPVLENTSAPPSLTADDFRQLKIALRGVMDRGTYNDLISSARMPAQDEPGTLILHVPTQLLAERINNMLAPTIEGLLSYVGAAGLRVRAEMGSGETPKARHRERRPAGGDMPVVARASPASPGLRQDPRAEELPF